MKALACSAVTCPPLCVPNVQVYRLYSELISGTIAEGSVHAARTAFVKNMRSVKKVALRLIQTFAEKCEDTQMLVTQFVPPMMESVLGDYVRAVPDARDAEVGRTSALPHQVPPVVMKAAVAKSRLFFTPSDNPLDNHSRATASKQTSCA